MFKQLFSKGLYFEADKGGAGGGNGDGTGDQAADDEAKKAADEAAKKAEEEAKSGKKAGDTDDQTKSEKKFTQEELDRQIAIRLERANKKAADEAAKAAKKAEEDALTKNQEFEKLANTRQTRIEELEKDLTSFEEVKAQAEKYKAALEAHLKAQTEKLPKHIKTLLEKMDPVEQIEYLTANAKELNVKVDGVPATPEDESKDKLTQEEQARAKKETRRLAKNWF